MAITEVSRRTPAGTPAPSPEVEPAPSDRATGSSRPAGVLRRVLTFPNPVNEVAARTVATLVVVQCALALVAGAVFGQGWPLALLAYGFWARVLAGPRVSPAGLFATRVVAPRLTRFASHVPGPPKRFAQAIGTIFTSTALVLWFAAGLQSAALVVIGALAAAAFLEAALGYCLGCTIFALGMRIGLVPPSICAECADISGRL